MSLEWVNENNVEVLCKIDNKIVAAKQNNIVVTAFHPELTDDVRFLKYFLSIFENTN